MIKNGPKPFVFDERSGLTEDEYKAFRASSLYKGRVFLLHGKELPEMEQPQLTGNGRSYYDHPTIEGLQAKDVIEVFSYHIGTAMAYLWRAGRKPGVDAIDDIEKAMNHLAYERSRLMRERLRSKPLTQAFADLRAEFGQGWQYDNAD